MMSTCGATKPFRFSTDDAPAAQRAETVRAMHERSTLLSTPEPMEPLPGCRIRVHVTQWAMPGLGILAGTLCGVRQLTRPERSAPAGADGVFFGMSVTGSSIFRQHHDEVLLHGGDGFLANRGDSGFSIVRPTPTRFIGLRFPRAALAALVPDVDCPQMRIIPRTSPALSLLKSYLSVVDEAVLTTPDVQRLVISQVYDLTALAIGVTRDRMVAAGEAARVARLQAIKSDIMAHLGDSTLSIAAVAARHHVTLRYLQKLFEMEGSNYSTFVLGERLTRAHRLLASPLHAGRPIGAIAYDVGFNDLSYFNRTFRRRYGATPSDVRHTGLRSDSQKS